MLLSEFREDPANTHKKQGNPVVVCNALYKAVGSFNCYLTPAQAIALARNLLQKAQLIIDEKLDDAVVHLWNKDEANEKLYCGITQGRKGPRKVAKKPGLPVQRVITSTEAELLAMAKAAHPGETLEWGWDDNGEWCILSLSDPIQGTGSQCAG